VRVLKRKIEHSYVTSTVCRVRVRISSVSCMDVVCRFRVVVRRPAYDPTVEEIYVAKVVEPIMLTFAKITTSDDQTVSKSQ
jgi:hypothetical protein